MAINFESALGVKEHAMRLRAHRANMLSSNLANVDTPNYKARDMDFKAELQALSGGALKKDLRTNHSMHMGLNQLDGAGFEKLYRVPQQQSIDGNTVEEHVEHAEFMRNSLEFQVGFTLLNSSFKGLSKALRGE
ncbi:flagellar basal body rod protein FlgB [Agaribacterium haliotis]|uniref:flagellar basal body rod protein FlgB n=1 Tax=Agaribacterium haliotis TaxID=2013869 RepID=UPI000BB595B9|nr:flagellar basal body rod protein FlgB [Agaribacterium haliotis]